MNYIHGISYLSKEELLKAIGEEPIVEDESDRTQIAMVLQYRRLIGIINSLPTYVLEVIPNNKKYEYDPIYVEQKSTGFRMCFDRWREVKNET